MLFLMSPIKVWLPYLVLHLRLAEVIFERIATAQKCMSSLNMAKNVDIFDYCINLFSDDK